MLQPSFCLIDGSPVNLFTGLPSSEGLFNGSFNGSYKINVWAVGLNPSCGCDLPLCVAIMTTGFTVNTCHCAFFFVCYVLKMNTYWQSEMGHQGRVTNIDSKICLHFRMWKVIIFKVTIVITLGCGRYVGS